MVLPEPLKHFLSFVDRDMAMWFRGGGVGHKSTREATDSFLTDRHGLDIHAAMDNAEGEDSDEDLCDEKGPSNEEHHLNNEERPAADMGDQDMEAGDYVDSGDEVEEGERENDDGEEEDWEDESELEDEPEGDEGDITDDALGPDDGEVDEDDIAALGFAAF